MFKRILRQNFDKKLNTRVLILGVLAFFWSVHLSAVAAPPLNVISKLRHFGQQLLSVGKQQLDCGALLSDQKQITVEERAARMQPFLIEDGHRSKILTTQTVFFVEQDAEGSNIFRKKKSAPWFSNKELKGYNTLQGDPRNAILLLGPELAALLGFDIFDSADGEFTYMVVPSAEKLKKDMLEINEELINAGKDPLSYLPLKSKFLTDSEIFELSLSEQGEFLFVFPYADSDAVLLPHELSYHLNLLLTKKINRRVRMINERYKNLVDRLTEKLADKHPQWAKTLTETLISMRVNKLDTGSGTISAFVAKLRNERNLQSYSEVLLYLSKPGNVDGSQYIRYLAEAVEMLIDPELTPTMSAVRRLENIVNHFQINFSDVGVEVRSLIKEFKAYYAAEDAREYVEIEPPEKALLDYMSGLDERIAELTAAARRVQAKRSGR